jgi:hypothetical protein
VTPNTTPSIGTGKNSPTLTRTATKLNRRVIDNHQDSFEKWRYLHEIGKNKKIDYKYALFSMDCFIRSIKTYLKTLNNKDEI